jgi:nickel-type superoxide dismutase maturation protease
MTIDPAGPFRGGRAPFQSGVRAGVAVAAILLAATPFVSRLARGWGLRGAIEGDSMAPLLRAGDWVLVDPDAYGARSPRPGELVIVADPRDPRRVLVKRVAGVAPGGLLELAGDNPGASTDSRVFGPVDPGSVRGRPWARYWPPGRVGFRPPHR